MGRGKLGQEPCSNGFQDNNMVRKWYLLSNKNISANFGFDFGGLNFGLGLVQDLEFGLGIWMPLSHRFEILAGADPDLDNFMFWLELLVNKLSVTSIYNQ